MADGMADRLPEMKQVKPLTAVEKEKNMAEGSNTAREISLGEDFGDVAVKVNVVRVEVHTDGSILAFTNGRVDAYTNGPVQVHAAANDSAVSACAPQIGDLDGGGVYVGKSATNGKDLHAALGDEPKYLTFGEAFEAAEEMRKQPGRENAHVPTPEELNVNLYLNKDKGKLSGTFNTSGSLPASCYRSSAPVGTYNARVQWFDDGFQISSATSYRLPVRLVW